ncbi:uncharacterized protein LOC62_03G003906 [Vanrija pseudolonga]|uniref:BTB domain-containing protein n=1 Tax=Vanrija pseudolonga TaxID=143232 RepID=A0AAF0Y938_9TREE|nr:hypothetical protein LOC62_03G003906 [Vanrija pseudolonga]
MSSPRHRSTSPTSDESDHSCSSSRTPTPAPIIDDANWTTGEFTLISADGVRFKIPSYVLLNASSVFRDIASLPCDNASAAPAPEIELTDATIETADVLRIFLSLAAHGTLGLEPREVGYFATLFLLKDTIGLCTKYLADGVLHVLKLQIYKLHSEHRGLYALYAFVLGAVSDDVQLTMMAFSDMRSTWVDDEPTGPRAALRHGFPGGCTLCPQTWPLKLAEAIPLQYSWALNRAWMNAARNAKHVPACFENLLLVAKGQQPTKPGSPLNVVDVYQALTTV